MDSKALVLGLILSACSRQPSKTASPAPRALDAIVATCPTREGNVEVRRSGEAFWQAVEVGTVFRRGDWIRTADRSSAQVSFLRGGSVALDEKTVMVVGVAPPSADQAEAPVPSRPILAVQSGQVRAQVGGEEAVPIVVQTADGQQAVLSATPGAARTEVRIVRGSSGTEFAVDRGEATLAVAGTEKSLAAGKVAQVRLGGQVDTEDLIDFPASVEPGIDARFRYTSGLTIKLAWRPVSGAAGYRAQVAKDMSFQSLLFSEERTTTEFEFAPPAPGTYTWRVATRDVHDRWGEYGFVRRIYCEVEQPKDLLLAPPDGAHLVGTHGTPPITFSWLSAGDARSYRLIVARTADLLRDPVLDRVTGSQSSTVEGLSPGNYAWGVYAQDVNAGPIFLKPRQFSVKKVTAGAVHTPKVIKEWGQ